MKKNKPLITSRVNVVTFSTVDIPPLYRVWWDNKFFFFSFVDSRITASMLSVKRVHFMDASWIVVIPYTPYHLLQYHQW